MKKVITIIILALTLNSCAFLQNSYQSFRGFFLKERDLAAVNRIKFTVDLKSPSVDIGQIEAQLNRPFPQMGLAKHDIKTAYFPFEDAVCLEYRINGYYYYQFWHKNGRDAFRNALEIYTEDYSTQKLKNKNNKTKIQYGTIKDSYLRWQAFNLTMAATGNMEMYLGYYFRDGAPFFSVTQMEAFFKNPSLNKDDDKYSPEIPIFFTRTQADELAALFDHDYLVSITPEVYLEAIQESQRRIDETPDMDDYQ
jgi:hypothetical protein